MMPARLNNTCCIKVFLFSALLLLFTATTVFGQIATCDACGQKIERHDMVEANGKFFHKYHLICAYCGNAIKGSYYIENGMFYDPACFKNHVLPPCAYCNKPLDDKYTVVDGKSYHEFCFIEHIAMRCNVCEGIILDEYLSDYWGNRYHKTHLRETKQCDYCQRLIAQRTTDGGYYYDDGRNICKICYNESVAQLGQADSLAKKVIEQLTSFDIDLTGIQFQLHLVSVQDLADISETFRRELTGFTRGQKVMQNDKIIRRYFDIYILYGMPVTNFKSTFAHEAMHVWQYIHANGNLEPAFREGSCNYAAYLILKSLSEKQAEFLINNMMQDDDEEYGVGFRNVKKFIDVEGVSAWLKEMKSSVKLPDIVLD